MPRWLEVLLDPAVELLQRLPVVGGVAQDDVAVRVEGHPVVGVRQVLDRQPEVDRVLGDVASANIGASPVSMGFSPRYIGADDLPTICTLPIG